MLQMLRNASKGNQPIRGIVHAAGVLRDRLSANMGEDDAQQVLAPKITGGHSLHAHTVEHPLCLFVLFSSIAAGFGNVGQTAYSAGNTYLDSMSVRRQHLGLPSLSIQWPAISGVGMWAGLSDAQKHNSTFHLSADQVVQVLHGVIRAQMEEIMTILPSDITTVLMFGILGCLILMAPRENLF